MENKRKILICNQKLNAIKVIDQNYLNNGGHDEFFILKIEGHKSKSSMFSITEHDIYGKLKSYFLTEEELIKEFGKEVLKNLK